MPDVKIPFNVPNAEPKVPEQPSEQASMSASVTTPATEKKTVRKRGATRQITPQDINFVLANVRKMSYSEMADKLGLTKHQVNRILMDIKRQLREEAKKTGKVDQVEKYIQEYLSRPEDARVGGHRHSAVKSAINATVSSILQRI